jgi:hypothetical protein
MQVLKLRVLSKPHEPRHVLFDQEIGQLPPADVVSGLRAAPFRRCGELCASPQLGVVANHRSLWPPQESAQEMEGVDDHSRAPSGGKSDFETRIELYALEGQFGRFEDGQLTFAKSPIVSSMGGGSLAPR